MCTYTHTPPRYSKPPLCRVTSKPNGKEIDSRARNVRHPKPRTAYGMRAHGTASAAGLRSAMKLKLYGYTGGCKFSSCCTSTQNTREKWL